MATISAIIPAYNEEKRIQGVLRTLCSSKLLTEIICIDDGSTDNTLLLIKEIPGIKIIHLKENHGKAFAIAEGLKKALGDIVLFVDADITGLTTGMIEKLVRPLMKKTHDVVIGCRTNTVEKAMFRPLTGERVYFRKDLLIHREKFKYKGYGLELYLNYAFKDKKVKVVFMQHVSNIAKHEKQALHIALIHHGREMKDMLGEILEQKHPVHFFYYSYLYNFYSMRRW